MIVDCNCSGSSIGPDGINGLPEMDYELEAKPQIPQTQVISYPVRGHKLYLAGDVRLIFWMGLALEWCPIRDFPHWLGCSVMLQRHMWNPSVRSEHINQLELKLIYLGHLARLSVPVGLVLSEVQAEVQTSVQETLLIAGAPSMWASGGSCSIIVVHCNIWI